MKRPRVLLADDHRLFLEGLRSLLEKNFEIVGMAENGRDLVEAAQELNPDVIVADVSMPSLNGIEATRQIIKDNPGMKVILLTMHPDSRYAARGFDAGAKGYVLKHAAYSELVNAIRETLKGNVYVSPVVAGELVGSHRSDRPGGPEDLSKKLTPRQLEVLQLHAEGRSAKEIAAALGISTRTVEFHKYRMMEILGIKTSAELVRFAIKQGIISL
jgi:DNA-binding NarL/FixJ family response regulator